MRCFSHTPIIIFQIRKADFVMGRASRNKRDSIELRRAAAEQRQLEAKKQKRTATVKKVLAWCAGILAVLMIAGVLGYNRFQSSGFMMRKTVSVSTENYEVDNAMFSYFFFTQYQNFMQQYGDYAAYLGLDTTKSLKFQPCAMTSDGSTWFQYFANGAVSQLNTILRYCEEGIARGMKLEESDYADIDTAISSMKAQAKTQGMSASAFIKAMYGRGVNESDVRRALELVAMYSKVYNALLDEFQYTDADYDAYVAENPNTLLKLDYSSVTMSTKDGMTEGDVTAEILADYKTRLEAAEDKSAFDGIVFDYMKTYKYKEQADKTEDVIREEVAALEQKNAAYSDNDFMNWAIAAERQVNDVYVTADEAGETVTAYILTKTAALPSYDTVDVRHILLTTATYGTLDAAKAKAEELLTTFKSGDATGEAFGKLANDFSEDGAENGLYTGVMQGDMVDSFNDWIFAEGRKAGDTGIVETEYGVHVMYLEGFGDEAWKTLADNKLKTAAFEAAYKAMEEKYAVTVDQIGLALLDV